MSEVRGIYLRVILRATRTDQERRRLETKGSFLGGEFAVVALDWRTRIMRGFFAALRMTIDDYQVSSGRFGFPVGRIDE